MPPTGGWGFNTRSLGGHRHSGPSQGGGVPPQHPQQAWLCFLLVGPKVLCIIICHLPGGRRTTVRDPKKVCASPDPSTRDHDLTWKMGPRSVAVIKALVMGSPWITQVALNPVTGALVGDTPRRDPQKGHVTVQVRVWWRSATS